MTSRKNRSPFVALFVPVFTVGFFIGDSQSVLAATVTVSVPECENCNGKVTLTGNATVGVSPSTQTVSTRATGVAEQIGVNTAQYTVSGACTPTVSSCSCTQVSCVEPSWSITSTTNPPTISIPSGTSASRTVKVYSSNPGEWQITFTAKVTYKLKNHGEYLYQNGSVQTVSFSGTGSGTFKAVKTGIIIYSFVGNILNPPVLPVKPYYDATVDQISIPSILIGKSTFGHASFKIHGSTPGISTFAWYNSTYINNPCGFTITSGKTDVFIAEMRAYPVLGVSPKVDGYLKTGDTTNGTNKDFTTTIAQTESAVNKAKSIHQNPPQYVLHSNNCVDATLAVATMAGLNLGTCRYNVRLVNTYTGGDRTDSMTLPNELVKKL